MSAQGSGDSLPPLAISAHRRPKQRRGQAPVRYFDSWLGFTADGPGLWRAAFRGHDLHIEKRRAEPGCPSGWYYFGPGHPDGEYAGPTAADAAIVAMDCVGDLREATSNGSGAS